MTKNFALIDKGTPFKLKPVSSAELPGNEKLYVPRGRDLELLDHSYERNQHRWLKLADPLVFSDGTSHDEVYVYDPHVFVKGELYEPIMLEVPYYSQNDNAQQFHGPGWRQCNLTSHAMMLEYVTCHGQGGELKRSSRAVGYKQPESAYGRELARFGDTINHDAHTACLREVYDIESYFSRTLGMKDILMQLRRKIPVVLGVGFKRSGHIIVAVGADFERQLIFMHDPYGVRLGASDHYDTSLSGAFDAYSFATLDQIFWDYGPEDGWGRIVTSVKGVPTGMPKGL